MTFEEVSSILKVKAQEQVEWVLTRNVFDGLVILLLVGGGQERM